MARAEQVSEAEKPLEQRGNMFMPQTRACRGLQPVANTAQRTGLTSEGASATHRVKRCDQAFDYTRERPDAF